MYDDDQYLSSEAQELRRTMGDLLENEYKFGLSWTYKHIPEQRKSFNELEHRDYVVRRGRDWQPTRKLALWQQQQQRAERVD